MFCDYYMFHPSGTNTKRQRGGGGGESPSYLRNDKCYIPKTLGGVSFKVSKNFQVDVTAFARLPWQATITWCFLPFIEEIELKTVNFQMLLKFNIIWSWKLCEMIALSLLFPKCKFCWVIQILGRDNWKNRAKPRKMPNFLRFCEVISHLFLKYTSTQNVHLSDSNTPIKSTNTTKYLKINVLNKLFIIHSFYFAPLPLRSPKFWAKP